MQQKLEEKEKTHRIKNTDESPLVDILEKRSKFNLND